MLRDTLGPLPSVQITQVSSFSSVLINRFHYSILTVRNVTTDDQGEYHCCVSEWRNKVRSRYGHVVGKLFHSGLPSTLQFHINWYLIGIYEVFKYCMQHYNNNCELVLQLQLFIKLITNN